MQNIEDFKKNWQQHHSESGSHTIDETSLQEIARLRSKKQTSVAMKYFWASLALQLIVYALLSHLIISYHADTPVLLVSVAEVLLYLPFTVMLLRKYKRMAELRIGSRHHAGLSVQEYIAQQHALLSSFYRFKRSYELILIPVSTALLIWVFSHIYLPGGLMAHPIMAIISFLFTLGSCAAAIMAENKRNFRDPLQQYEVILQDLKS